MYLLRQDSGREVSPYGQARQQTELMEPDTGAVVGAMVEEATSGIGTLAADIAAYGVTEDEKLGTPLTKDQYRESAHYRDTIPYYRGMTNASASALAEYDDDAQKRAEIVSEATGGQYALGMAAAFGAGVFEPKNIATGLLTSLVLTPAAGAIAPAAGSIRRLMKMRQMSGQYGGKIALGAIEGGVSAAIAEPSNQYSASILKQDYTMADSAWNIALSTAFGVGASAAGIGAPIIRDKWQQHGARTPDVIASEFDTAVSQLATGKRVDVGAVEIVAFHGTDRPFVTFKSDGFGNHFGTTEQANSKAFGAEGARVIPVVLDIKNPLRMTDKIGTGFEQLGEVARNLNKEGILSDNDLAGLMAMNKSPRSQESGFEAEFGSALQKILKDKGHDGAVYLNRVEGLSPTDRMKKSTFSPEALAAMTDSEFKTNFPSAKDSYISFEPSQIKSLVEHRAENTTSLRKAIADDLDPNNDTAIDTAAWHQLDEMEETMLTDSEKQAVADYEMYMKEISAMKREGMLSKADEEAMLDALNSTNEKDLNAAYDDLYACLTRG